MRKLKLFLAALAMIVGGVNCAWAYTVNDLTSAGWEEVTSLPTSNSDLGKYYYVFWATEADLMLAEENGQGKDGDSQENQLTGVYRTPADPASDKTKVWILEYNSTYLYGIRNLSNPQLLLQTRENATYRIQAAWERRQSIWTKWDFIYADGKWTIQNKLGSDKGGGDNNWMGPWDKDAFQDNMVVAGNAGGNGNAKSTFKIYRKLRINYNGISYNYASATSASPLDVTGLIANANFDHVTAGWDIIGEGANAFNTDYTAFEAFHRVSGVSQDLTDIPNGKYTVSVQVGCRDDNDEKVEENLPHLIATSAFHTVSVASNASNKDNFDNTAKAMSEDANYGKISVDVIVTDRNLNITLSETNNNTWPVYDNFTLTYSGPTVAGNAIALPDGGAMTAGQWYYFDIPAAAEYNAKATTISDIVYTTDGTILIENESTITQNFTVSDNSLTKARYYVKSSSPNNLVIAVSADTYTLNESSKTTSITAGQYLNSLTTFVVTYPDAETTSSDELTLVGTATATLLKGESSVATGTLAANNSAKALTATFDNVVLDPTSTYTIQIAAGVFGYEGNAVNEAISISFNTGVIADGVYYFKRSGTENYLTRGGNYGTENVTDKFGISFEASLQPDGTYTLKNVDQSLVDNTTKYLNEQYTDQTAAYKWTIEATTDGYLLKRANGSYVTTTEEGTWHYNYMSNAADKASAIVWTILTKSEYQNSLSARKDNEAKAIAKAASVTASTETELISKLVDFVAIDMTSSISNASLTENADGWTAVSYNSQRRNQAGEAESKYDAIRFNGTAEVWSYIGGAEQTIAGLPEGIYKLTVKSVWRIGDANQAGRAAGEANVTAWMYATSDGVTDYTQLKSWYDHQAANTAAVKNSTNDDYVNTVYVYVPSGKDLTIGIASPSWSGTIWMPFCSWTLTRYETLDNAKEELAAAINAAEANLGFEIGEYAPYNNVDALQTLAAAKAINVDEASGAVIVAATTALTEATWTANTEEVNAIAGGEHLDSYTHQGNYDLANGWSTGGDPYGYKTRIQGISEGTNNIGLEGLNDRRALLVKFGTSYGEAAGYTLPLKANTTYKFSFTYGLWNEDVLIEKRLKVVSPSGETIAMTPDVVSKNEGDKNTCGHVNKDAWYSYEAYFTTSEAGNYVLNIENVDGNNQRQMAFADLVLKKAVAEDVTIAESADYTPVAKYANVTFNRTLVEGWNGLVLPFDMTVDEAKDAFNATAVKDLGSVTSGENGAVLNFVDAAEIKAGRPFMLKAAAGTSYTINNVLLTDDALQTVQKASDGNAAVYTFTGTYAGTTDLTNVTFFLINGTKYYYHTAGVNSSSAKAFRAYFVNETPTAHNSRVSFNFGDDTTTGIEAISTKTMGGEVYNLNGQKVEKAQKGLYIVNGKKVVIK